MRLFRKTLWMALFCAACPAPAPVPLPVVVPRVSSSQPAPISLPAPATSLRTVPILVAVDEELRRASSWQLQLEDLLDGVNKTYRPLGLAFRISSFERWEPPPGHLSAQDLLDALRAQIPAPPGSLVLGFTGRASLFSATFDQIGLAYFLGDHAVLRSLRTPEDFERFLSQYPGLAHRDREEAYRRDVARRTQQVLEHELGHLFGALHTDDARSWMYPTLRTAYGLDACNVAWIQANARRTLGANRAPFSTEEIPEAKARYQACGAVEEDNLAWAQELIENLSAPARQPSAPPLCGYPARDSAGQLAQARCLAKSGEPSTAEERLQGVLRAEPGHKEALLLLAQLLVERGAPEEAVTLLSRARLSRDPLLLSALGEALARAGDDKAALAALTEALALAPDDPWPRLSLSVIYLRLRQYQDASDLLRDFVEKPEFPYDGQYYLGLSYLGLRQRKPAQHALESYAAAAEKDSTRAEDPLHQKRRAEAARILGELAKKK